MADDNKRKRRREVPLTGILAGLVVVLLLCAVILGMTVIRREKEAANNQQTAHGQNQGAGSLEQEKGGAYSEAEPESETETDTPAETDPGTKPESAAETEFGTGSESAAKTETGAEQESEAETESGAGQDGDAEADNGSEPGSEAGIEILIETEETQTKEEAEEEKFVIAIDPGHQGSWVDMSATEPVGPGASEEKAKSSTGTAGRYSGLAEYELNLQVSLLLREELERRGYEVVLTREDNDAAISNSERALLAYEEGGDVYVRIHANGSEDSTVNGALAMVPSADNPYVGYLAEDSLLLAECILNAYCEKADFKSLGIQYYDNMTGINWSQIPVMILEMGFMTNESDDLRMADETVQTLMVEGIADGIDAYFEQKLQDAAEAAGGNETQVLEKMTAFLEQLGEEQINPACENGESWAVSLTDLATGAQADINGDVQMKSASVLKAFIMAAVYDRICYPSAEEWRISVTESYDGELRELITNMITVSDNNAANALVRMLGGGDSAAGMAVVNQFCEENGFTQTRMGRLFLESDPADDNYTSANDCRDLLAAIYNGTCVNEEASAKMYEYLKNQTRTNKIPEGLTGTAAAAANKTGELAGDYGDYVENDIAIISEGDLAYVLCVLSENLNSNSSAIARIVEISGLVYENAASW